jgi:hypothetical protein
MLITVFTKAHHWNLVWNSLIQFAHSQPIPTRSNLISFSYFLLRLPSDAYLSGLQTSILYGSHFYHACYMLRTVLLVLIILIIGPFDEACT